METTFIVFGFNTRQRPELFQKPFSQAGLAGLEPVTGGDEDVEANGGQFAMELGESYGLQTDYTDVCG